MGKQNLSSSTLASREKSLSPKVQAAKAKTKKDRRLERAYHRGGDNQKVFWNDIPVDITTLIYYLVVVEAIRTVSQEVDTYPYLFKGDYGLRRLFGLEVAGLFALPGMLEEARYHIRCMRAKHADTVSNWRLDMDRHCARLASKEHFNLLKQFEIALLV
jgi:hypothetical protein